MDVEVEGGGDGGVAEDDGDGFVVAAAFDATGGEGVAQGVETDLRDAEIRQQTLVERTVGARFGRFGPVREEVVVGHGRPAQWAEEADELMRERDLAYGRRGFGRSDRDVGAAVGTVGEVDALDRFPHAESAGAKVNVLPLKPAQLADPQPRLEADEQPEFTATGVRPQVLDEMTLIRRGKHRRPFLPAFGQVQVHVHMWPRLQPLPMPQDHPRHDHDIMYALGTQAFVRQRLHERLSLLHTRLAPPAPEKRDDVVIEMLNVDGVGRILHPPPLLGLPIGRNFFEIHVFSGKVN